MSAMTRFNRLQAKVAALEAAGLGDGAEAVLARQAMEEVRPLLEPAQTQAQELLGVVSGGDGGKITESPAKAPRTPRAPKIPKAEEPKITDTVGVMTLPPEATAPAP